MSWASSFFLFSEDFGIAPASSSRPRLMWGIFLLAVLCALAVLWQVAFIPLLALLGLMLIAATWRYPLLCFYVFVFFAPLWGAVVSVPTSSFASKAFQNSIDLLVGEIFGGLLVGAWAVLVLWKRRARARHEWRPWLPLFGSYGALVLAHLASVFSSAKPDPFSVIKYAFRPVFSVYLFSVLLPVNFIRSRRTLQIVLSVLVAVGVFFALDGLRGLLFGGLDAAGIPRARPLPWFGTLTPLGGNQHALAELLLYALPAALALSFLVREIRIRRVLRVIMIFLIGVTLLTLARTAWIVLAIEIIFLFATVWRPMMRRFARAWPALVLGLGCVALVVAFLSMRPAVQSSTDARAMITDVGWHLFLEDPVLGAGAGAFVDRVRFVKAFTVDFGDPIDSHGVIQKILAETGLVGALAFLFVCIMVARFAISTQKKLPKHSSERYAFFALLAGVLGAFSYQLSSTSYWTPRLWLAVGILFAAGRLFLYAQELRDPDFLPASTTSSHV